MNPNVNIAITKEILISLIQEGYFEDINKRNNADTINTERTERIIKTFRQIHKSIYEACKEESDFWNS